MIPPTSNPSQSTSPPSMTRDGVPPAAPPPPAAAAGAGGGAGDGPRRCSQCGHHGHNARTCTARPVKLFGVRIGDKPTPIRKSASMGNLAQLAAEGAGGGGREEGYGSDGERPQKKRGERAAAAGVLVDLCFPYP